MRSLILISLSFICLTASARPHDRYHYIGRVSPANPFQWDTDTVNSDYRDYASGIAFELDRGIDVEIGEVVVYCRGGRVCDRMDGGMVTERRSLHLQLRRDMVVESIQVRSRMNGFSIPPPRVNVYLETWY